jgi:hypothetical protein
MANLYEDRWISCGDDGIRVRWYYLWGTKRIPYRSVRGIKRVRLTPVRGKARIWGTANPRYWASLDPKRATKQTALVLDLGRFVRPFLSPEDPDAFERVVRERSNLSEGAGQTTLGPIV